MHVNCNLLNVNLTYLHESTSGYRKIHQKSPVKTVHYARKNAKNCVFRQSTQAEARIAAAE